MMEKYKYLIKNMSVLTIASFCTKILNFLLVPLYTSILTTEEYGTYDLINTTIMLLIPIMSLNLGEGLLRYCLDDKYDKEGLVSITFRYFIVGYIILNFLLLVNYYAIIFPFFKDYFVVLSVLYLVNSLVNIITLYTRGIDKVKIVAISGVIGTAVTLGLNVLFLVFLDFGLIGYFLATIIGGISQVIFMSYQTHFFYHINLFYCNKEIKISLLSYSVPLIINSISWWVNNASDRYVVTYFYGVEVNGVYSVAYKIPSVLVIFNTIFNQAWVLSSTKEYNKNDQDGFFSTIYNYYNMVMVIVCSILLILNKILAHLLFKGEFFGAWIYSPFLLISVVFGALSGYIGGLFSATLTTKVTAKTVFVGALINIILNFLLVKQFGVIGVAYATLISYFVVWVVRIFEIKKIIILKISFKRDLIAYTILLLQAFIQLFIDNIYFLLISELSMFCILVMIYIKVWGTFFRK